MEKLCSQTTIPQVDNTDPECLEYIKEGCIVSTKLRLVPIAISVGETYEDVLDKLLLYVKSLEERITILET